MRFHDVAYVEATPRYGSGRAGILPAASGILPGASAGEVSGKMPKTAGRMPALPDDNLTIAIDLTGFSVHYSQGVLDAISAELKEDIFGNDTMTLVPVTVG